MTNLTEKDEISAQVDAQKPETGQDQEFSETNPKSEPETASESVSELASKED